MSTFEKPPFSVEDFSGVVRLFPLPNLVLFPHVMQPLHVFEPRYRALLEAALEGDQLIAMAVLAPGWESDYEGRPVVYPTACLGRISTHHELDDGTYNVLLWGLRRVQLVEELETAANFREAKVELDEDACPPSQAAERRRLQRRLRDAFVKILPLVPEVQEQLDHLLGPETSLSMLTDVIGYMLDINIQEKVALLAELDVCRRAELLLTHLSAASVDLQPGGPATELFPPRFSCN